MTYEHIAVMTLGYAILKYNFNNSFMKMLRFLLNLDFHLFNLNFYSKMESMVW